jgi:hypothetical protein
VHGQPREVGGYLLRQRLGEGGMGVVYAATDQAGATVAVKLIKPELAAHPDFRARFAREAGLAGKVSGVCTVRVLAMDVHGEHPWIAMNFVPGPTLEKHVAVHGPLARGVLDAFALGVAEALASLHAARVVHRDLKPGNVILGPAGPVILDFGIARALDEAGITGTGEVIGSRGWISPERYAGVPAAFPADVFAWGAITAFAATGRRPFGRGDDAAIRRRTEEARADLLGTPDRFLALIPAALAVEPALRPSSSDLLEALVELVRPGCVAGAAVSPSLVRELISERWKRIDEPPQVRVATQIPDRPRARVKPVMMRSVATASRRAEDAPATGEQPRVAPAWEATTTAADVKQVTIARAGSGLGTVSNEANHPRRPRRRAWRRSAPHAERRRGVHAVIRSWIAEPGTEPRYGARALLAALSATGWLLSSFWAGVFMLSTHEVWHSATAHAVGTRMGTTAAAYVAGLLPLAAVGMALFLLIRTEGIRPLFVAGNAVAILLGGGMKWLPILPSWLVPDAVDRGFARFGGIWGEYVVLIGFIGLCALLGLWVRGWLFLGRWLGLSRPVGALYQDGAVYRDRLRRWDGR